MGKKIGLLLGVIVGLSALVAFGSYLHHAHLAVFQAAGTISQQERNLIVIALLLSLIVVIPVFTMFIAILWRYRAGNTKAAYSPKLDRNNLAETVWWLIPSLIILVLSIITWTSSHTLDPYRSFSNARPLTIQVVSLDWKWLFIYPDQGIATVNYVQFPEHTPVTFDITSDTVMNSFWIPRLAGQIYAMPGMSTQLHIMARGTGSYNGSSANISGKGFAGMTFTAKATSAQDFSRWTESVKHGKDTLDSSTYAALSKPSENNKPAFYASVQSGLYDTIVMNYMMPMTSPTMATPGMQGMQMQ